MQEQNTTMEAPAGHGRLAPSVHHICVCICTLQRPGFLSRTLERLKNQRTEGMFTYSVVVADNDAMESAQPIAVAFAANRDLQVEYCVEPLRNIALARNRALKHAGGDFVAFIDDDEFPVSDWLLNLFKTYQKSGADGVLGPVRPHFDAAVPAWVTKGRFFERPEYATGHEMTWEESRTGNVLFRKELLNSLEVPFREQFGEAGEDMDFFRRAMNKGYRFVWCNEAVAYETVPAARCTRSYLLRRALLRGSNFPKHPAHRLRNILKSLFAVPAYALALPVLLLLGQHVFLKYLIKLFDHASRLLAFIGWRLITARQP